MLQDQDKLIERAQAALVQLNLGINDDAQGVIHDLIREIRRMQDEKEKLL